MLIQRKSAYEVNFDLLEIIHTQIYLMLCLFYLEIIGYFE